MHSDRPARVPMATLNAVRGLDIVKHILAPECLQCVQVSNAIKW